jgi:hypothetical protein
VPFSSACLRCASAYCSNASCDGSFNDKKPNTEPVFFFFGLDDLESLEDALDAVEARLGDVRLAESNDGRMEVDEACEEEVAGGFCCCWLSRRESSEDGLRE